MYTAIVVASLCRFESLMGTIRSSVLVQQDRVGIHTAILKVIHSLWGRCGMMYKKTGQNSASEQEDQRMTRILEGRAST